MHEYTPDFSVYARESAEKICSLLNSNTQEGLSLSYVQKNKQLYGSNTIHPPIIRWWNILWNQCSPPFIVLFACLGVASLVLGELTNALIIFSCMVVNLSFGFYQEYSTSKAMTLLQKYLVSYVKVIREGTTATIPSQQLVVGDLVIINAGDRLFADMRIVQNTNLMIDESALTGESIPVHKTAEALTDSQINMFEAHNIGFAGTTVTNGNGHGIVFAIGEKTVLGTTITPTKEDLRQSNIAYNMKLLSTFLIKLIIITLCCVLSVNFLIKGTQHYIDILIFATALAVSITPEALPIVVTFCLSSGAAKLAKKKVLIKRLSAVEDLGTVDVLCTDKTGTLTENKTTLVASYSNESYDVIAYAALATEFIDTGKHTNKHKGTKTKGFDTAIHEVLTPDQSRMINSYQQIASLPYDPLRKLNSALVQDQQFQRLLIVRGMQEDIVPLCHNIDTNKITTWISQENVHGYRIIAIGIKTIAANIDITDIQQHENNLTFVGLIAFDDPLKPTTYKAIQTGKQLGLHIKILSGDNQTVCFSVAQQLDLVTDQCDVITGTQFMALTNGQQRKAVRNHTVFAHCLPEHKLRIMQLLQETHRVAYLGDGINDIPALKIAHVSMAVQDAMDVTRDAADIILLEKSLLVIIDGIKEGRKVVINTLKYIKTTLSNNFGNLYSIALVSLFVDYLPILPIHIIFINLLSDFPLIALSTDTVDNDAIAKPQQFSPFLITTFVFAMGFVGNMFDIITFAIFHRMPQHVIQMAWYMENMLTALSLIFATRTNKIFFRAQCPSTPLLALSLAAMCIAILPFYTAVGRSILVLPPLSLTHLLYVIAIVSGYFITTEIIKHFYYAYTKNIT